MANLVALRSAIRASRATLTASRAVRRSTRGGALDLRSCSGCPLQLGLLCICGCAQAVGKTGVLGPVHLNLVRSSESGNATMGANGQFVVGRCFRVWFLLHKCNS